MGNGRIEFINQGNRMNQDERQDKDCGPSYERDDLYTDICGAWDIIDSAFGIYVPS